MPSGGREQSGPLSQEVLVPLLEVLFPEPGGPAEYTSNQSKVPPWPLADHPLPQEHPLKVAKGHVAW